MHQPSCIRNRKAFSHLPLTLIALYLAMACMGMALLRAPGMLVRGNELSATEALFAAVNAATLTGFEPETSLSHYTLAGRCVLLGLIAGGTIISLVIGGFLIVRLLNLPIDEHKLIRRTIALFGAGTLTGTALLWHGDRSLFEALFLACSAMGNCGLAVGSEPSIEGRTTHAVLLPLAFVGTLGAPVIVEMIAVLRRRQPSLSRHSRMALTGMLGTYLLGTGTLWLLAMTGEALLREGLITASAASLDARTVGFGFASPDWWSRGAQWVVLMLMAIGGASGGAGGGMKVTTVAAILVGTRRSLQGQSPGRSLGIALVWVGLYLGLVLAGMLVLLNVQPQIPGDRMLFEVISAVSNVGLGYGPVSMVGSGMFTLCALMLAGRFLPFVILLWMAHTTRDADVAVG